MGTSKMDSSAVYGLFEELKQKVDEIGKKTIPDNQTDSTSDPEELISLIEDLQIRINQQQFTPEQIEVLQTNLAQYSAYSLGKVNESLRKVITELKALITPIDEKINLLKSPQNLVIRKEHIFSVDFRNSKAVITIIAMSFLILVLFGGNIWQFNGNSQLKDNDLKYRYIKSLNGINSANLYKLENIFHYDRDKKLMKGIRQNVENWEKTIQKTAEKVEHEKIKNSKSKK